MSKGDPSQAAADPKAAVTPHASSDGHDGESTASAAVGVVALHSTDVGAAPTSMIANPEGTATAGEDEDRLPTFKEVMDLVVHPLVIRSFLIVAGIAIVLVALRVVTWTEIADGARSRYVKTALFGGASSMMVWFLVLLQTGAKSRLPIYCALAVMLAGDAVHYVRLANPIASGSALVTFDATFSAGTPLDAKWDVETANGGTVKIEGATAVLAAGPSATAYLVAKLGKDPDVREKWWLPLGLETIERTETLRWRATAERTGGYLVLVEIRNLLIQAVPYGLHVTYPDASKKVTGTEIQTQVTLDGKAHDWEIVRDPKEIRLRVDGNEIWKAQQQGPLEQLKLGETKRDAAHGGTLRIERASYRRDLWRGGA